MALYIISLVLGVFIIFFFFLMRKVISSAKEQGELESEIEESRHANDIQKEYENISSRPQLDADDILNRMHTDSTANK